MSQHAALSYLNGAQIDQLLAPINPARVLSLSKGKGPSLSYVAQHDVRAHMNRIFGFGRWSTKVIETAFVFEEQDANKRWNACYRATVRVEVYSPDGTFLAAYEDSHASGNAPQPDRAEAHALALTIAVSTAMKRACTCLGDQFGLSLYNKGQKTAFVKGSLIGPGTFEVAEVNDLGETPDGYQPPAEEEPLNVERPAQPVDEPVDTPAPSQVDPEFLERLRAAAAVATIADRLQLAIDLKQEAASLGYTDDMIVNPESGFTLGKVFDLISKGA